MIVAVKGGENCNVSERDESVRVNPAAEKSAQVRVVRFVMRSYIEIIMLASLTSYKQGTWTR